MIRTNNREFKSHPDLLYLIIIALIYGAYNLGLCALCCLISWYLISSTRSAKKHWFPFYRYETEALIFPRGSFPAPYSFFGHTVGHMRSYFPDHRQNPQPRPTPPSLEARQGSPSFLQKVSTGEYKMGRTRLNLDSGPGWALQKGAPWKESIDS